MDALAIKEALAAAKGNVSEAARKLGLTRSKLRYRLRGDYDADKVPHLEWRRSPPLRRTLTAMTLIRRSV